MEDTTPGNYEKNISSVILSDTTWAMWTQGHQGEHSKLCQFFAISIEFQNDDVFFN